MTLKPMLILTGIVSLAGITTACAGGGAASSVAGPSASSFPSSGSGATIIGTIATPIGARSFTALGSSGGLTVSITGTSVSSPVDSSGKFTLTGVPAGDDDLHVSGGGQDAHVRVSGVGEHEHIDVTLSVSGTIATVEDSDRELDDNDAEVEGLVKAIDLSARTLTVRDKTISVPKDTPIKHGDVTIDLTQIKVGDRVHIHGTKTASGITATRVTVQNAASTSVDHD